MLHEKFVFFWFLIFLKKKKFYTWTLYIWREKNWLNLNKCLCEYNGKEKFVGKVSTHLLARHGHYMDYIYFEMNVNVFIFFLSQHTHYIYGWNIFVNSLWWLKCWIMKKMGSAMSWVIFCLLLCSLKNWWKINTILNKQTHFYKIYFFIEVLQFFSFYSTNKLHNTLRSIRSWEMESKSKQWQFYIWCKNKFT